MKKLLKVLAGVIVAGIVLIAVAVVALPMLVDPQDIKDQLSARVKAQTGRDLAIPGEVELSVFPWLGASLGEVSVGNAPGFTAPVFASTSKVDVRVKLQPLLSRRLEMDTVTVHGLTLNLERNKQGATNWDDLAGEHAAGGGAKSADQASPGEALGGGLAGFAIGGIDVRDGALSYTDRQTGQSYSIGQLNFTTGTLSPGKPVDLELAFDLSSANPALVAQVKGTARVDANVESKSARIDALRIVANLKGDSLPGGALDAELDADVTVDGIRQTATASKLTLKLTGLALPGGKTDLTLVADVAMDGTKQTASVRNLALNVHDLAISGALDASGLGKSPALTGDLALASFNPRELLKDLGQNVPDTSDANALSKLSLTAGVSGNANSLALKPLTVILDDSTLRGEAKVSDFARPALRFALQLDAIDLDRYLPPGTNAPPATPGAAASKAAAAPGDALRALDVAGTFNAGKVKVAKLNITDVNATLNAKNGVIRLSPVAARLYQGSYAGNITVDARNSVPAIALDEKLSGVQAGPLLQDLQGKEPLTGTANVTAKLRALGTAPASIKASLNGDLSFEFLDGAVKGVNIGKMIRDARSTLRGGTSSGSEPAKTDFASITGTAKVTDGVVSNQDLNAQSPLLRVAGKGTANLVQETIDYKVTATVVATSKGQGGKGLEDLAGVPIPVHVTGTFADPKYGLDMEGLATALAKSKANEVLDAQKGKIVEKAQEKLGDSVGKLLGTDKQGGGGAVGKLLGGDEKGGGLLKNLLGN